MFFKRWLALVGAALFYSVIFAAQVAAQDKPILSVKVGRYQLQSNPWVNLHQRLLHETRFKSPPPARLSGADLTKWNQIIEDYRAFLGERHPIFNDELVRLNAALSAAHTDKLPASIPAAAAKTLAAAMPLYRSAQWEEDDRANRFWIAAAVPLLASAAEELAEAHTKAYARPFPTRIMVDVSPAAWQFGAYTVGQGDSAHVVISSTDPGYKCFASLEMLMHEPSHAIADGDESAAIGADLKRAATELGVKPMSNLWHAILFYTSGELTRRALVKRGVRDYQPFIMKRYDGPFRGYRQPLETHWQAYLDGKLSREAAIRQIVMETTPAKK